MLEHSLPYSILRTNLALTGQAASYLSDIAGVTISQWRVMSFVGSGDFGTSRDILAASNFDPAVISRAIHTLEKQGLLTSERQPEDRRVLSLSLTKKGREIYERAMPLMVDWQDSLVSVLTDEEQKIVSGALAKLEAAARDKRDSR